MGFLGRGRGGQRSKGRGGGIHASTQKSKDRERSKSSSSSTGRDRDRDGRGSSANKDADDKRSNKFENKDFSKESLRITVGNDMYREQSRHSKSPLSDRLGPPVDRDEQKQRSDFDDNLYRQEEKFYGERSNNRGNSYDRDHRSSRDIDDRRQDHYRDERRDRDDRKDRHDRRDESRDYPDRYRDGDRHSSSYDDRGRGYGDDMSRGIYKDPAQANFPPVAIPPAPKPLKSILKKAAPASATNMDDQSSSHGSVYSTPNPAGPIDRVGGLFPIHDGHGSRSMLGQQSHGSRPMESSGRQQFEPSPGSAGRQQRSGLPGMSSYMDIEDEEKFLYGDDDKMDSDHRDRFPSNKPPYDRQQISVPSQMDFNRPGAATIDQQMHPRPDVSQLGAQLSALRSNSLEAQLAALRNGGIESQLAALKASGFGSQLSSLNLDPARMDNHQVSQPTSNYDNPLSNLAGNFSSNPLQQDPYNAPQEPAVNTQAPIASQGSGYTNDLLSIFTNKSLAPVQPSVPQPQPLVQPVEEKQPGYDPTIENILKSIGFDFEMSKRMQEKAQKAPKEEEVFGINEGASFLEGGLSDDIKKKLFKQKEESMVDKFLREVKSRPAYAVPPEDSDHRHERNQDSHRDSRDSRDSERKHERYDDRKYDSRRSRSRSHSVDRRYKRHRHSRSRSRTPERKISREHSSDKKYGHKRTRSRSRSRSIEIRYSRSHSRSNSWSDSESLSSISSSGSQGRRYKKPRGKKRSRSPLDGNQTSTYPTQPLDSLSSGIPFHRQISSSDPFPAYTQAAPPIYSQPSYPAPPSGPYGPPPAMYPDAPPPVGWQQTVPPFTYNVPPPGYMPPRPAPPGVYPHYPDSQVPPGTTLHPPGTVPVSGTQEKPAISPVSGNVIKISDGRTRTLQAVQVDRSNISKSSKSESSKKSEDITEKKTITIEKKTISITSSESNRTVIPPKKESSKSSAESESKPSKRPAESPKKVLTTKDKNRLIKERDLRKKRIESLEEELRKLRRQQNEIMRKKRRQKDGHKDPVLLQNSKLQDEISIQISKLRKLSEEGLKTLRESVIKDDKEGPPAAKKIKDMFKDDTPEKSQKKAPSRQVTKETEKDKGKEQDKKPDKEKTRYDFFDPGGHWCKVCNMTSGSIYSVLQHLHGKKHQQNMNQYDRPWVPAEMSRPPKVDSKMKVVTLPVKGQEFLVPCKAFYCTLCEQFAGDEACADFHLKSDSHYQKYEKFMSKNSMYETRLQLDRKTSFAKAEKEKKEAANKKQTPEEKQQADKRVKEKEKKWEKKVDELEDPKDPLQKAGFDKFPQKLKGQMELKKTKDNNEPKKEEPAEESKKDSDAKSKIEIHIASKRVMPTPLTGKMPGKKNPLLPPWTPVSKQEGAKGASKVTMPLRKQPAKVQTGKPPSLDLFLSIENGDKGKPLPVVSKIGEGKQKVTAKDILEAFSGKRKDDNALQVDEKPSVDAKKDDNASQREEKPKTPDISKEEMADMKMLGINPEEHQPIAEVKAPPPPSQNLSLPENYQKQQSEENKRPTDEITAVKVEENVQPAAPTVQDIPIPDKNLVKQEPKESDGTGDTKSQPNVPDIATTVKEEPVKTDVVTLDTKNENIDSIPEQSQSEATAVTMEEVSSSEILEENKFCDELLKAASTILDMNIDNKNPPVSVSSNNVETLNSEETSTNKDESLDITEDIDDVASDASGISMHMGSDFEVLDECQEDDVTDL